MNFVFRPLILSALLTVVAKADPPAGTAYAQTHAMSDYHPNGRTLAQALVDRLPSRFPRVQYGVIHALLPGGKQHGVIASHNPDQVGALDDAFDDAITEHQVIMITPRMSENFSRTVVVLPMKDASGALIRASWAIYLKNADDDYPVEILRQAVAVRDAMAASIPSLDALYSPGPASAP
jgi:hypothetical protein